MVVSPPETHAGPCPGADGFLSPTQAAAAQGIPAALPS